MKLRYTERAIADLEEIRSYIARDNPSAAVAVGNRIERAIGLLENFPHLGRPGRVGGTRVLQVARTPYAVYYKIDQSHDEVAIVHIRHGRRRVPGPDEL